LTHGSGTAKVHAVQGGTTSSVLLGVAFALLQLGWLWVCMIAFALLGYDGGGFAGGAFSPVVGVLIALAPSAALVMWLLARRGKQTPPGGPG
jgi:hypothetical protein